MRLRELESRLRALGLASVATRGRSGGSEHHGSLDGQDVLIAVAPNESGGVRALVESSITPALDLGLDLAGERRAAGDEPARVQSLLTSDVTRALRSIVDLGLDVDVDDAHARAVETRDLLQVLDVLGALARVTSLLGERARRIAPATPLASAAEAWSRVAAAAGLSFTTTPLAMHGTWAAATTRRTAPLAFTSAAWVGHPRAAEIGVSLRRARVHEPDEQRGVSVGDAAFDRLFTVAARDPAAAQRVLDVRARDALSALALLGEIRLDETGLSLTDVGPDDVPRALDLMRCALEDAVTNLGDRVGPYR